MWQAGWRDAIWGQLEEPWDIVVVGGGITGAGILREATRLGLRTLLIEQRDFAWGTSSRSSKLVHGGLRYLKEGRLRLTRAAVRERKRLLAEGQGLIDPLGFLLVNYRGDKPGRWTYNAGLAIYDLLALQWSHRHYSADDFRMLAPHIAADGLRGGFRFGDAQTDDARLVLRVLREAVAAGGVALNYARADHLLREGGRSVGVRVRDVAGEREIDVRAAVVINATGAWADYLRSQVGAPARLRPLRGSHLVFPAWRFPLAQAITFLHPVDYRPMTVFPWEGITLVGTTDLDHAGRLDDEPHISGDEVAYLMAAVEAQFPALHLTLDDVTATFAGIRPVIDTGKADPSAESRDHVIWQEDGLLTVTGGKLTTFRLIALDALKAVRDRFPGMPAPDRNMPALDPAGEALAGAGDRGLGLRRLAERYGADAAVLLAAAADRELEPVPGTPYIWAELRWAAADEGVVHLDDLLLRRVRLGLLLPDGGRGLLPAVRTACQEALGWDDARWAVEEAAYVALIERCYSLPPRSQIPAWQPMLARARAGRQEAWRRGRRRRVIAWSVTAAGLTPALTLWLLRRRHRS